MNNVQTIIDSLMTGYVNQYALPEEAQATLERIRERVVSSADVKRDVEMLYGTRDCEDMALGLMWVIDRAGQDEARTTATSEEEQVVHTGLTAALTRMGFLQQEGTEEESGTETGSFAGESSVGVQPTDDPETTSIESTEPEAGSDSFDAAADQQDMSMTEEPGGMEEAPATSPDDVDQPGASAPVADGSTDPSEIGSCLEQLLESLQAGEENREQLMASLRSSFAACLADGSTDPSLKSYAEAVDDFLGYVQENDLLDDVRVMNFFTNVQEPYAQWLEAPEGEREGVLEQAIEFLSDFRSMFE